ncbi:hypothetical protein DMR_40590 [Solidesulfovibrio magneticus RS-1]|uniref:Uncharacterized protein n=1 Tax=Solidesulfovibrio magneticus (strain ATCC 700980 / DSM 13731 / RS-1) TaxID=573370 RepID=C4XP49_SOLM1|nr:hypothetical protein DMR_40590 [Solidesulfovibrio magneticus RS-1]
MADVIISPPNNTSHEASFFSDNVIIYPHRNDVDVDSLRRAYQKNLPFIDIKNTDKVLNEIKKCSQASKTAVMSQHLFMKPRTIP